MAIRATIGLLVAAGAAVLAIAGAPDVGAAPGEPPCSATGGSTQCQISGDVQIYAAPQPLPAQPKTTYGPFLGYHNGRL